MKRQIISGAAALGSLAQLDNSISAAIVHARAAGLSWRDALRIARRPIAGGSGAGPFLSEDCAISLLETADIGGTNASTSWVPMAGYDRVFAYVEIGTWNSTDDLDECRLQQGQTVSGTNAKDLTSDASGADYDTDNPVDADGDFVILEARAEDLDVANAFDHVRLYVAEAGNTGVDNVTGFLLRYGAQAKRAQKNGAAVTGSKVYVRPS